MSSIMEASTEIVINLKKNPAVSQAIADGSLRIGDAFDLTTVKSRIKELTPDSVVISVGAFIPDGFELDEESEETVAPPANNDVTMPNAVSMMVKRKKD